MKTMLPLATSLAAALLLVGCGKSDEGTTGTTTPEQAAEAASGMAKPEPGKYKSSVKILEFDIPGVPAAQAEQMKAAMGGSAGQSAEFCLTPEDAAKGYEEMVKKSQQGNCTIAKFDVANNNLDAQMSCDMGSGMKSDMTMTGTTSTTGSTMVMDINQTAPGIPGGKMHTKMEVKTERIGDCA